MLDALDTSMACVCFFTRKLPPTSKGEVEDGRHVDTDIRKGQDHNKSLSISGVEYDNRSDLETQKYSLHMSHIHVTTKS
jgi:hypothetical protein